MTLDEQCLDMYRRAHAAFLVGNIQKATSIYAQIRAQHSCELYYEVDLPTPMRLSHPVGTVLGRATYAPFLMVHQNCTVGSDLNGNRPVFTGPCCMFAGSMVIGRVTVGSNVYLAPGAILDGGRNPLKIPCNGIIGRNGAWSPTKRSIVMDFFTVHSKPDSAETGNGQPESTRPYELARTSCEY